MAFVEIILVIILIVILFGIYQKNTNRICTSRRTLRNKTALVTGGTTGMGLDIATELARREAKVIIACPFEDEGLNAKKHIIENTGNERVIFMVLDLASLKSTRNFAENILNSESRLDILINNAGVGIPDDFTTADNMSFIMQVNYFGHFLLTLLLMPLLRKSGQPEDPSRIVNTSSVLHLIGKVDLISRNRKNFFMKILTYANSKFCLALFSRELTKRLRNSHVIVNSVDPGAVGTKIFDSAGYVVGAILTTLCSSLFKTSWQGAQTALHVALDERSSQISGEFFRNCRVARAKSFVYCDKTAEKLWQKSVKLVNLTESEIEHCLEL